MSAYISALGNPRKIYDAGKRGGFETFWSAFMRDELRRIWIEKFALPVPLVDERIRSVSAWAKMIEPNEALDVVSGCKDDNRIVECAVATRADYLVSGDKAHLLPLGTFRGTRIVDPETFVREILKIRAR